MFVTARPSSVQAHFLTGGVVPVARAALCGAGAGVGADPAPAPAPARPFPQAGGGSRAPSTPAAPRGALAGRGCPLGRAEAVIPP